MSTPDARQTPPGMELAHPWDDKSRKHAETTALFWRCTTPATPSNRAATGGAHMLDIAWQRP
eukprot:6223985-Lingulodinium_polyedra.AAC.1